MANKSGDADTAFTLERKTFDVLFQSCDLLIRRPLLSDAVYKRHTQLLGSGKSNLLAKPL